MRPVTSRSPHRTGSKVSKPTYSNVATQLQCFLCKESVRLIKCEKFLKLQVQQRLSYVKQSRLCFNCLQPFTRKYTRSNQVCRRFHNRYNLLHINGQARPNNRGSTNHHRSADEKGNPTAEVNTYCSFKGKPQNQILLATSVVELRKILVSIFHEEHSWTADHNLTLSQRGVYSV